MTTEPDEFTAAPEPLELVLSVSTAAREVIISGPPPVLTPEAAAVLAAIVRKHIEGKKPE